MLKLDTKQTFGFYTFLSDAENAVETNKGDIHELLYNYVVLEDFPRQGIHPMAVTEMWYRWSRDKWVKCPKPKWTEGMVNWALG